jgi:SAM-dependent methyltransferase
MSTVLSGSEKMARFYSIFPYPNRPWFVLPNPDASIMAHAGIAHLLASGQHLGLCEAAWRERRRTDSENKAQPVFKSHIAHNLANEQLGADFCIASVGCGTDEPVLLRCLHPFAKIHAFDISKNSIQKAKFKLKMAEMMLNMKGQFLKKSMGSTFFYEGDAAEILTKNAERKFHHIQCFGVLHHQQNPEILLNAMAKSLLVDGTLRLMVYTSGGRRLERGIQKKWSDFWKTAGENQLNSFVFRLRLHLVAFKLLIWRVFLSVFGNSHLTNRFAYLGYTQAQVADALLHPSDPGLPLESLLLMLENNGLETVFCEASMQDQGWKAAFGAGPLMKQTLEVMSQADKVGNLNSNVTLVLKKLSCGSLPKTT